MALDVTDWTVSVTGDIRWTGAGTATNVTVLEMHRFLQDLADDAVASGDDLHDITDATSSDRSTDNIITLTNGYNIDDTAAQHIYDGSITQAGGATVYSGLVVVGAVVAGTNLQIVQDHVLLTNYWGSGLNVDAAQNILLRIMAKTRVDGANIDGQRLRVQARELGDTYAEFSLTAGQGNSTAAIFTSTDLNNGTAAGTLATYDQFTNTEGYQLLDLDGDASNEPYYGQWTITGGGATPATPTVNDLYEYTKYIGRRGTSETLHGMNGELARGITHDITYDNLTGAFVEDNYLLWGTEVVYDAELSAGLTVGEYYDFSISGSVAQLIGLDDNGTTGSALFAVETGTIVDNDVFTRSDGTVNDGATVNVTVTDAGASGGRGVILADEGSTRVFIQLISGSAPVDNLPIHNATTAGVYDAATNDALVNVTVTSRTVSPEFLGTSTGSALIGAYGIAVDPTDTTASDQFFDLNNAQRVPPNNVTFTVSGLISGEDRVLVGPENGSGGLDIDQLSLDATLSTDNITSITVTEAEPNNTPSTGTLRLVDDNGVHRRLTYSSLSGSTFTISTTDGNEDFLSVNATAGNDVYLTYVDELASGTTASYTAVFDGAQTLFVRVRDGGGTPIKTFETTGSLGSGGGSSTAIRTSDA